MRQTWVRKFAALRLRMACQRRNSTRYGKHFSTTRYFFSKIKKKFRRNDRSNLAECSESYTHIQQRRRCRATRRSSKYTCTRNQGSQMASSGIRCFLRRSSAARYNVAATHIAAVRRRYDVQRYVRRLGTIAGSQCRTSCEISLRPTSPKHVYKGRYADRGRDDEEISCPVAVHPVVRTHPDTKRQALYVNRAFTTRINELSEQESSDVLEQLFEHSEQAAFQIRFRWSQNDMAFWDNRCCMHRAIWDYWPEERKGRRVTIKGDRPS